MQVYVTVSALEELNAVTDLLQEQLSQWPASKEKQMDIRLCLMEAVQNGLLYGKPEDGGKAEVYVTSGEGEEQFRFAQLDNADLRKVAPSEGNFIQLKPESHRQPVYGFGAAITGSTCYNLLKMSEEI